MMFKTLLISIILFTAGMSSEELEMLQPIGIETMQIDKTVFKQITEDDSE
jgi:phosphotransferase system IIA component